MEELGRAFEQARVGHLHQAGFDEPDTEPTGHDLGEMTREELYKMAKDADIPGRSAMNKDQLSQALRTNG